MRFGSFLELPRPEGATSTEAYEQTFAHVDMAEELGLERAKLYGKIRHLGVPRRRMG